MSDEILKKLQTRLDRRGFLRGSALAAGAVVGIAAVSPLIGYAQEPEQRLDENKHSDDKDKKGDKDKKDDKTKEPAGPAEPGEPGEPGESDKSETKLDAEGREYRSCPQCGYNMYRQGRTWTCENCGYSYVE
jgi:rubredoxin